jgi:methionyl aminopeptidase
MSIVIKSRDEIRIMREAGRHVAEILQILRAAVRPGLTVSALDRIARNELRTRGLTSTFLDYRAQPHQPPYPATVCVSINDEVVHGIPRDRVLAGGDLVSIDFAATYRGYVADSAFTVGCGAITPEAQHLIDAVEAALRCGIDQARAGLHLGDVGRAIERSVEEYGFGLVDQFGGHGVGRAMHEEPFVSNRGQPGSGRRLRAGMVIAIEPMVTAGGAQTRCDPDGWTIRTADGSLAAHAEHTIAVTDEGPLVLTAL